MIAKALLSFGLLGIALGVATSTGSAIAQTSPQTTASLQSQPGASMPLVPTGTPPPSYVGAPGPGYRIQGGDQISISVAQDATLTQTTIVLDDGTIVLPLIGRIAVGWLTPESAAHAIALRLKTYVRNPAVTVTVLKEGDLNIIVLGDVKTPGKYLLRSQAHLLDAIAAAGGLNDLETANYPDARISTPNGNVMNVPLKGLMHDGDMQLDYPLEQGSVIYVPGRNAFDIQVLGAVDKPGDVEVHEGDRISMAIAKAGDSRTANSDLVNIRLTRHYVDGETKTFTVDLAEALQRGDERYDIALKPGDVVFVPESRGKDAAQNNYNLLYILSSLFRI